MSFGNTRWILFMEQHISSFIGGLIWIFCNWWEMLNQQMFLIIYSCFLTKYLGLIVICTMFLKFGNCFSENNSGNQRCSIVRKLNTILFWKLFWRKTILEISTAAFWETWIQFFFGNCFKKDNFGDARQFWKQHPRYFISQRCWDEQYYYFTRSTSCDKTMYFSFKFIFARATIAFVWTLSWWESSTSLLFWIIEKAEQLFFF